MNLNPEQQQAVDHFGGPCIVTAVPGSGKTRTLTSRVVNLIKKGVGPSNILCLTFTNKAANEMRERVATEIGDLASSVWISTFHSFFLAILRRYCKEVGLSSGFSVYGDRDQRELIEKIARMQGHETNRWGITCIMKAANDFREDIIEFETIVAELKPIEADIVKEYLETLKNFNAVDFSGILWQTYRLLKAKPKAAEVLSSRFKYILVDEWQDTNTIQYETIKLLADNHKNLFVVGDPQQSIFAWRGAKPENIGHVRRDFEGVQEITLPRNYRSTAQILDHAQRLIRHNADAKDVKLLSEQGDGEPVRFWQFATPEDESAQIAQTIQQLSHKYDFNWNDCAILYRTNSQSKLPEIELRKQDIPYRIYGGFSFFDRKEVKTTMAYLKFLANTRDTQAFNKAIRLPARGVGDVAIGNLERYCQKEGVDMLEACKNASGIKMTSKARESLAAFVKAIEKHKSADEQGEPLNTIAEGLLNDTGFYGYIKEQSKHDDDWQRRVDNVNELLVDVTVYGDSHPNARIADYLQSMELITSDELDKTEDAVTLLTMHSAKGLEFPVVFVIGVEKDLMPHRMAVNERGEDEERRLLYVAATRAKQLLFLTHCQFRRKWKESIHPSAPSPFLYEMNPEYEPV
jgi:DNA helicase-2/ATP-dependent DNA helicase PcrA